MRNTVCGAAVLAALWSLPASAVNTETYQIPYFGAGAGYLQTDSVRNSKEGTGVQFTFGIPFDRQEEALELHFFDYGYERPDGKKDFQTGLFVDYVRDFGPIGSGSVVGGVKPFVNVGIGFIEEDVRGDKHLHFGAGAGAGVMIPVPFAGWALRFDVRIQGQSNNESCSEASLATSSPCSDAASYLIDYQVGLGLQVPLTIFFDRPVPIQPVEECPIAVVDPVTGRSDCASDSDRDGVPDERDQCPGTPPGTPVNRSGCPRSQAVDDADGDGVGNARDQCPDTPARFKVNADGCIVAQKAGFSGVTFEANSARLTQEGRRLLDGMAAGLAAQKELAIEIAGHTDDVGSQAYNLLLSQQRAEAVRAYLVELGVEGERLTAIGYGEEEPVAPNSTEAGREANRRVEFRISVAP